MMDELEPVWIGNAGKCVKTKEVGEGEKNCNDVLVLLSPVVVLAFNVVETVIVAVGIAIVVRLFSLIMIVVVILLNDVL